MYTTFFWEGRSYRILDKNSQNETACKNNMNFFPNFSIIR